MRKKSIVLLIILCLTLSFNFKSLKIRGGEIEYIITNAIEDIEVAGWGFRGVWIKWNVSTIPLGYTVISATAQLYHYHSGVHRNSGDGDATIWRISSQTWAESDSYSDIYNLTIDTEENYTDLTQTNQYVDYNVTEHFNVNLGNNNFSLRIWDPDYAGTEELWDKDDRTYLQYGNNNAYPDDEMCTLISSEGGASMHPKLRVIISTQPPYVGGLGYAFNVEIQPATIIPTDLIGHRIHEEIIYIGLYGFRAMETNDGEYFSIWSKWGGTDQFVIVEFESKYWLYADTLTYEAQATFSGSSETVTVYDYHPTRTTVGTTTGDSPTTSGTHTITDSNWYGGIMQIEARGHGGDAIQEVGEIKIDILTVNFTAISQVYTGERIWNGTEYLEKIWVPVLEPDTNITINNVPENYEIVGVLPDCNYDQVGQTLTLFETSPTIYEISFSTSLTRPDLVTIVLNYYSNITKEPLPANTLNSSYVVAGKEYRIESYTSKFVWDKDDGNPFIRSYDYFGRLLVNQSFEIPEDSIFYVVDVGLQLYRLTVHCNVMATLNITNSLNESYSPTFEVSPENATLIKTLWLYGENLTITTHSNDYGDLTHQLDSSRTSFANFKYRIPVLWKGEREMPRGKSALLSMIEFIFKWLGIAFIGYLAQHYWRKYRLAEKIDRHIL